MVTKKITLNELRNIVKQIIKEENSGKQRRDLIGKRVVITSDNDNYDDYRDLLLKITHAEVGGRGYDRSVHPDALCSFVVAKTGEEVPYSLYEYEFKIVG